MDYTYIMTAKKNPVWRSNIRNIDNSTKEIHHHYNAKIESTFKKSNNLSILYFCKQSCHFCKIYIHGLIETKSENFLAYQETKGKELEKSLYINDTLNEKEGKIKAKELNSIYVNTPLICNLLGCNKLSELSIIDNGLTKFLDIAIATNGEIKSYKDDRFSIPIPHCYNIHFKQYLGQQNPNQYGVIPSEFILSIIQAKKRVIIQSLAGSGKTFLAQLICKSNINKGELARTIMLLPTRAITSQATQDFIESFKGSDTSIAKIEGGTSNNDVKSARDSSIILCCYDSLNKIEELLPNSMLIIDEYHQLVNDVDFRNKIAFRKIGNQILKHPNVIMLSATPNYFFALDREIDKAFGYTLIKGIPSIKGKITITPKIYKKNRYSIPTYVVENTIGEKGLIMIKYDSKAILENTKEAFNNREIITEVFHADNKRGNKTYDRLMNSGYINDPKGNGKRIMVIGCTRMLEAGVSIYDNVSLLAIEKAESHQSVIQQINRPRYNAKTDANKNINVWIFKREEKNPNKKKTTDNRTSIEILKDLLISNQLNSNTKNLLKEVNHAKNHKTDTDDRSHRIEAYRDENGIYKPCIFSILHYIGKLESSTGIDMLLERVARLDDRVTINQPDKIDFNENKEFKELIEKGKKGKKESIEKFKELVSNDFQSTAQAICFISKDLKFKEDIVEKLKLPIINKSDSIDFVSENSSAFAYREPKRIIKDIAFLVSNTKAPLNEIISQVINTERPELNKLTSLLNRKLRKKAITKNENPSASEYIDLIREREIIKHIDQLIKNIKKRRVQSLINKNYISKVINTAIKKINKTGKVHHREISKRKAIATLKDLYEVNVRRVKKKGKQFIVYEIDIKRK